MAKRSSTSTDNDFFDSIGSILTTKKYWLTTEERKKKYAPVGVSIGLSQHMDCIFYVNELNRYWKVLTPQMHYDYLFHSIRKMNRKYSKWSKRQPHDDLQAIQEYYGVNRNVAKSYKQILSSDQIATILRSLGKSEIQGGE